MICGYGRFGRALYDDLRAEGLDVTVVEPQVTNDPGQHAANAAPARGGQDQTAGRPPADEVHVIVGDASSPAVLARADLMQAVGFVAGTDNDTTNLSLVAAARRLNPGLVRCGPAEPGRAMRRCSRPWTSTRCWCPTEVVAHEVYAQLSTPLLWRFLQDLPHQGDDWAAAVLQRLRANCGRRLEALWKVQLTTTEVPALVGWLAGATPGWASLLHSPDDRERRLHVVTVAGPARYRTRVDAG